MILQVYLIPPLTCNEIPLPPVYKTLQEITQQQVKFLPFATMQLLEPIP